MRNRPKRLRRRTRNDRVDVWSGGQSARADSVRRSFVFPRARHQSHEDAGDCQTPGISVGNFYNYFENKDAIIDEFAQREVARLAREIDEIVNGRVSLEEQRRQFRESLRKQLAVQRARVKIEIIEEAARNSSMGEIVKRSDAQVRELIKKMHRSRSSAEVSDEEIEVMVEMDMALVDGMAFRLIAHPELDIERMINAIVKTVIR